MTMHAVYYTDTLISQFTH